MQQQQQQTPFEISCRIRISYHLWRRECCFTRLWIYATLLVLLCGAGGLLTSVGVHYIFLCAFCLVFPWPVIEGVRHHYRYLRLEDLVWSDLPEKSKWLLMYQLQATAPVYPLAHMFVKREAKYFQQQDAQNHE